VEVMKYIHPKEYKGVKINTKNNQLITKARVDMYCLKCDLFMGREHDFSECQMFDKWKDGKIIKRKTCPVDFNMAVSLVEPGLEIISESYEE